MSLGLIAAGMRYKYKLGRHALRMEPVNLLRVFIASPGDVAPERKAVADACFTANREWGDYLKVRLETIAWETHTIPTVGMDPQKLIFKQIPFERLDLFVGVLCDRFGTPTEAAGSGTEDEFQAALDLHSKHGHPHIMLYFGDKKVPTTAEESAQKTSVIRFRDTLERALYQRYKRDDFGGRSAEQVFAEMFKTHLSMWLSRTAPPPPRSADVPEEFKIIHLTLSDFEWYHLLQLSRPDPHPYRHQDSLEREMRTLERMQLVRFKNQATRWQRLPQTEFLLPDHVDVTDFGRRFVEWRRQFPPYDENW